MEFNGIKGILLFVEEGINGIVFGSREGIDVLFDYFNNDVCINFIFIKELLYDE